MSSRHIAGPGLCTDFKKYLPFCSLLSTVYSVISNYIFNYLQLLSPREALDGCNKGFHIGGRLINNLRYADDVVLIAILESDLRGLVTRVPMASSKQGLSIIKSKTKVMVSIRNHTVMLVSVDGEQLEQVDSFVYLGSTFTADGS